MLRSVATLPSHARVSRPAIGRIRKYAFPPADDTLLFVCGVPGLYTTLCGPRTEKELADGSVLKSLGYTAGMVAKM